MLRTHVGPLQAEPKPDNKNVIIGCNLSSRETQQHNLRKTITVTVNSYLCLSPKVSDPDIANHHSIDWGLGEPSKIHSSSDIACKNIGLKTSLGSSSSMPYDGRKPCQREPFNHLKTLYVLTLLIIFWNRSCLFCFVSLRLKICCRTLQTWLQNILLIAPPFFFNLITCQHGSFK